MNPFEPDFVFVEPQALDYPLGRELFQRFTRMGIPVQRTTSHNQVRGIPGETEREKYRNAKRTLVIGVRKTLKFEPSLPSAEYALPLSTGCMGHCHYCYLQTTMGNKPYIRVYVNLDEIFAQAKRYMDERKPQITRFEAACTSDPVGIEHLTGSLKKAVEFFGQEEFGRLRFVTKFAHVDSLLDARHNGHTRFRFSINAEQIIRQFEPGTSGLTARLEAARKVARAGYPLGFIIAPIIRFQGWEKGYAELLKRLKEKLTPEAEENLTFELIQHRFTQAAKRIIRKNYPKTGLDLDEIRRQKKYGRYGTVKYIYPKEEAAELENTLRTLIGSIFPNATIEYFT